MKYKLVKCPRLGNAEVTNFWCVECHYFNGEDCDYRKKYNPLDIKRE